MEYRSCPNLFIPPWAREFLAQHIHLEKHPHTALEFYAQRPRFRAFRDYFLSQCEEIRDAMRTGMTGAPMEPA